MYQKRDDLNSADQPPLLTVQCPISNVPPVTSVQCPVSSPVSTSHPLSLNICKYLHTLDWMKICDCRVYPGHNRLNPINPVTAISQS
ncbi:hypothetical protein BOTNAR_0065g00070 [Botryotinia narcissicola]|uniref:Uncharacterized protein n=1 Tax=Botryotinia narcissicola TaxID=278944 RepID=A0A4Z1IXS3_9HELO|nr:hypothetical protein BOTNAR_0065g00070 [Botryotinia narcissicola]